MGSREFSPASEALLRAQSDQTMSADDIPKEQQALLKQCFDRFDSQKNGCISAEAVGGILSMMGLKFSRDELKGIIQEIDIDGSGEIEFEEFLVLAAKFLMEEDEADIQKELKEAFRLYDKEGNGYITTSILREILREIDPNLSEDELDEMIDEIDGDRSGTVDFDEFMEMMTGE